MKLNVLKKSVRFRDEAGIALLTTLLLLFLMSSLLVGFTVLLEANATLAGTNDQQVAAFYGAEAGMEKLTDKLGNLFNQTYAPSEAQIQALTTDLPNIPGIQYVTGNGTSGYYIDSVAHDANGNPAPSITTIKSGTYAGMSALATEYVLMVNARTKNGREVTLKRTTQTVGIPMFQFGIFCDQDCSFFAGPTFNFGGRMHTNGNLFLSSGSTLTMSDKVDAYKDVVRDVLENGYPTAQNYAGTVSITIAPGGSNYRSLGLNEGSLTGIFTAPTANANWPTISQTYYNGNLQDGKGSNVVSQPYAGSAKLVEPWHRHDWPGRDTKYRPHSASLSRREHLPLPTSAILRKPVCGYCCPMIRRTS